MKWWEKTVEYQFVNLAFQKNLFNLFIPLDGAVEAIGDTVVAKDSKYYIIEFKKSLSDLNCEYKKFIHGVSGYQIASELMKDNLSSKSHFLIGGLMKDEDDSSTFELEIKLYFELGENNPYTLNDILKNGLTLGELEIYTETFTKLKNKDTQHSEGSRSGGSSSYSNVLAVSKSNKSATFVPLHYFSKPKMKLVPSNSSLSI